jgi:hypothetical protein
MELSTRTRRAAATLLAVALGVGTMSAMAAGAATPAVTHPLPADPPAGQVLAAEAPADPADIAVPAPSARFIVVTPRPLVAAIPAEDLAQAAELAEANARAEADAKRAAERAERKAEREAQREAERRADARREAKAARQAAREAARREARAAAADDGGNQGSGKDRDKDRSPSYRGRNHVWIPALGISRSVEWFPCSREREPDNYMYRWGCAGDNNVYLMGHAHSVMKPLHDAYVNGRLNKGMKVWYADNNSRVRVYAVRWWKTTKPTTDAAWAWAAQDVPSMTLQTCVGKNSQYRLMVRLTEVD